MGRPRASSSETNLRKLAAMSGAAATAGYDLTQHRPGSALGLLQGGRDGQTGTDLIAIASASLINRGSEKSQVRQCLGCYTTDLSTNKDQNSAVKKPKHYLT